MRKGPKVALLPGLMHCSAHTKKLINIKVKKLLSLSLEHTYTINYSCQIIESAYLQYLGYTTLTVKSQELYLGHSSPRRLAGEKKMPAIIIEQQFGFSVRTTYLNPEFHKIISRAF